MKERSASASASLGSGTVDTTTTTTTNINGDFDDHDDRISRRSRRYQERYRRVIRRKKSSPILQRQEDGSIAASTPFKVLAALLAMALGIQFLIVLGWHHRRHDAHVLGKNAHADDGGDNNAGGGGGGNIDRQRIAIALRALSQSEQLELKDPKTAASRARKEQMDEERGSASSVLSWFAQSSKGLVPWSRGVYVDGLVEAVQRFDMETNENENGFFNLFGLEGTSFTVVGPYRWEGAICGFRPTATRLILGENLAWEFPMGGTSEAHRADEEGRSFEEERINKLPFFNFITPVLNTRNIPNAGSLIEDTVSGKHPTIAGVSLVLDRFLRRLHDSNNELASREKKVTRDDVHERFVRLAQKHLAPFESTYRARPIFPIRDDDSVFVSLASFRDYLLGDTLVGAFDTARHPDKLFVGAIVQNCLGLHPYEGEEGVQCRTGAQVVGKNAQGRDQTKVSDAPPDRNGIEEFCNSPKHKKWCDSGHVRVLYLHENESLGPAMARYYASKLWGGESYFMQVDSHLEFYQHWDELYVNELKATGSYPKSILSSYPPGFNKENDGQLMQSGAGTRLCTCEFSASDVESNIIRINTGVGYHGEEEHPTQIPFIAAGFFFASAGFLVDVPFDPYMPWCFMGEEIMLSMRAWTHGWDIYAPRKNWIAHQYRPGRMGLPKFWGSVGRLFGRPGPGFSNQLQLKLIKRVKHLVGYEDCCSREKLEREGDEIVLMDVEHYAFGEVRSREEYLKWANIDVQAKSCRSIDWCNNGELL
eukprot:CAMPEP_0181089666 /NCGR_PEP_ID=MMETSP1071-20121207/7424_1 /TAXON_ID=35127 /ORGANISM="Thalassiosira sp., Strain NH16" /LENGTH=762 /DNA_ID=CAMNT_0023171629 /DNA_START=115 /DNA_END=2402 /DNA_ORIENTATION=+